MDSHKHDQVFYVTFAMVLAFLLSFTGAIMLTAHALGTPDSPDPAVLKRVEERIRPVGTVVTDPAALLALAAPAAARAALSGAEIATKVCNACHGTGVLGAPKEGEWAQRKSALGGLDGLTKSAIAGKGSMPPRGGDASLSDAEMRAAVEQLLK